jgi:hypothetical protein
MYSEEKNKMPSSRNKTYVFDFSNCTNAQGFEYPKFPLTFFTKADFVAYVDYWHIEGIYPEVYEVVGQLIVAYQPHPFFSNN